MSKEMINKLVELRKKKMIEKKEKELPNEIERLMGEEVCVGVRVLARWLQRAPR